MKRQIKLTKEEHELEESLILGEYVDVGREDFNQIAQAIKSRKKDSVLNIRVNSEDLKAIKKRAKQLGVPYQSFISEFVHRIAHS